MSRLIDPFARPITYLRVSVTDRCDLRCVYCMAEDMSFLPKAEILTLEELERLSVAFVAAGVTKLRITGGEPLVRRGAVDLIGRLGEHLGHGLDELTLTTNGTQLARHAEALARAGVRRINVSMDTLDPARFARLTRWGRLDQVLAGIFAARDAGLQSRSTRWRFAARTSTSSTTCWPGAAEHGFDLCLIETMPMGDIDGHRARPISAALPGARAPAAALDPATTPTTAPAGRPAT